MKLNLIYLFYIWIAGWNTAFAVEQPLNFEEENQTGPLNSAEVPADSISIQATYLFNNKSYPLTIRDTIKNSKAFQIFQIGNNCVELVFPFGSSSAHLGKLNTSNTQCKALMQDIPKPSYQLIDLACQLALDQDRNSIWLSDQAKINSANASLYFLFRTGTTFYEHYGFRPAPGQTFNEALISKINKIRNLPYSEAFNHLDNPILAKKTANQIIHHLEIKIDNSDLFKDVYEKLMLRLPHPSIIQLWEQKVLGQLRKLEGIPNLYFRRCDK